MYIVIELEIKVSAMENKLEYVNDRMIKVCTDENVAMKSLSDAVDATIKNGYFDEVMWRNDRTATLTNGGTAYKKYFIRNI